MVLSSRAPLRWLTTRGSQIILTLVAVLYIAFTAVSLWTHGIFDWMGGDFRSFLASAEIARSRGFAQVYDLATQEEFQRPLYQAYASGALRAPYVTVPNPYLPVFILALFPLLLLPPVASFAIWSILNYALLWLYLGRLQRATGNSQGLPALLPLLLCYAAFTNLFFGQANVWLVICLGEFLLAARRGQEFRGGLWLAGLLLKPQVLILLLPTLLLSRRFKALAGFAVAGLALVGVSILLAGVSGLYRLATLILGYVSGLPSNAPEAMMNWRALAVNLGGVLPAALAWGIAIAGMVVTAGVALALWWRPADPQSPRFALALLGLYAATCAIAWHSHSHQALPLLVPFLALDAGRRLPPAVVQTWSLLPALVFFVARFAAPPSADVLTGLTLLGLNLFLLAWATSSSR